jgi:hypothetical protein
VCPRPGERWEARIHARKFSLEDFAGLSIREAAELIRHEPVEHAVIYTPAGKAVLYVMSRPGTPHRVTVPIGKSGLLRGNVFLHNHPNSDSFSEDDIWILLRHGARAVHAYGPERAFRMTALANTRRFGYAQDAAGSAELHAAFWRAMRDANTRFARFVQAGTLSDREGWIGQTHSVARQMSALFRFSYQEV